MHDLKLAARRLIAAPLFTVFAVLSLAIGIGLTTAAYSVIDSIFLKALGIREPGQVVFVVTPFDGRSLSGSISRPDFEDLRAAQTSFSSVSASAWWRPSVAALSTPVRLAAEAVDGAYFSTLGVGMTKGRPIQNADEAAGARVAAPSRSCSQWPACSAFSRTSSRGERAKSACECRSAPPRRRSGGWSCAMAIVPCLTD